MRRLFNITVESSLATFGLSLRPSRESLLSGSAGILTCPKAGMIMNIKLQRKTK